MSAVCGAAAVAIRRAPKGDSIARYDCATPRGASASAGLAKAHSSAIKASNQEIRMSHLPPTTDDRLIWDMWESQFRLPACTVADELGLFRALSDAALTTGELAAGLSLDAHALSILLAALASSGLLELREGKWRALPPARTWLHPDGEGYWGGFLLGYRERNPLHKQLLEAMKTGKRPESFNSGAPEWERGAMSAEAAQRIASFMHSHSMAPARGAAAQAVFGEVGHLMDVGCGSGVYGIEIARAHPNLQVTLIDLAAM